MCSTAALDSRTAPHGSKGPFALCAPPLWLACYRRDHATAEVLLRHSGGDLLDADAVACSCSGEGRAKDCTVGGQSVLHVAVSHSASDTVQLLLRAGVNASAPCCFACDEEDEPEWDEDKQAFGGGILGLSALQLAALRSDDRMCALLLSHGAAAAMLQRLPAGASLPPALAPQLVPMMADDGEPLECPICYESLVRLTCVWTPCCVHPFHSHCIRGLAACPMCRASLSDAPTAPEGDAQLARALATTEALGGGHDPARRAHNSLRSTTNHDRALDLAFSGPQWGQDSPQTGFNPQTGSFHSGMGTNYGWRNMSRGPV